MTNGESMEAQWWIVHNMSKQMTTTSLGTTSSILLFAQEKNLVHFYLSVSLKKIKIETHSLNINFQN